MGSGLGSQMYTITAGPCVVAGVQTQVLTFVQQSLYPPRCLPSPGATLSKITFSTVAGFTLFELDV